MCIDVQACASTCGCTYVQTCVLSILCAEASAKRQLWKGLLTGQTSVSLEVATHTADDSANGARTQAATMAECRVERAYGSVFLATQA